MNETRCLSKQQHMQNQKWAVECHFLSYRTQSRGNCNTIRYGLPHTAYLFSLSCFGSNLHRDLKSVFREFHALWSSSSLVHSDALKDYYLLIPGLHFHPSSWICLQLWAEVAALTTAGCSQLVAPVGTVPLAVTQPAFGDTRVGARAAEEPRSTGHQAWEEEMLHFTVGQTQHRQDWTHRFLSWSCIEDCHVAVSLFILILTYFIYFYFISYCWFLASFSAGINTQHKMDMMQNWQ